MEYSPYEQKKFKQAPVGTHTGVCFLIADVGTQVETYEGESKSVRKVYFGWELPEEKDDNGKPLIIYKNYTLSFHEKATLAKDYKAWVKDSNPKSFKLDGLLGAGCNLNIGLTSGGNAKVTGISALKAKESVPVLVNEPVIFDMRTPNNDALARLPGFLKDKIMESPEYKAFILNQGKTIDETLNDSIPF